MVDGSSGGNDDDRMRDEGGAIRPKIEDPLSTKTISSIGGTSAEAIGHAVSGGDGEQGCRKEVGVDEDQCAQIGDECMRVGFEVVGPQVRPLDPGTAVEGTVITSVGFGGANGSGGKDVRDEPPPRDPARDKGLAIEAKMSGEVPAVQVEFRPVAGSSGHRPIT